MSTIKDVATTAGVSVGTVSRVLNHLSVKERNRQKVEKAISELGYEVNTYARGLKAQQTYNVAMIIPDLINPFFALLVNYVQEYLSEEGYRLLIYSTHGDEGRGSEYFRVAKQSQVDGMLVVTYLQDSRDMETTDIPVVSFDRHFSEFICCVSADNTQGGQLAAKKLIETGCKRVIYLRNGSNLEGETLKRGKAFLKTCADSGVEAIRMDFGEETTLEAQGIDKIYRFLEQNMQNGKFAYDGIFTSSDVHAVLVVKKLKELGVRIPQDVQVIGYDGLRILNAADYAVSTIAQPIEQLAKAGVNALVRQIQEEEKPQNVVLPVRFVDGGTTR